MIPQTKKRIRKEPDLLMVKVKMIPVIVEACSAFRVPVSKFFSESRIRNVADARKVVCYISRYELKISLMDIGRILNRDHKTVFTAVNTANDLAQTDESFALVFASVAEKFLS